MAAFTGCCEDTSLQEKSPSREDMTKDVGLVGLVVFFFLKQSTIIYCVIRMAPLNWVLIFFICSHCHGCALQEH